MIHSKIESLLLVSSKPIGIKKLAALLDVAESDARAAVHDLKRQYEERVSGFRLLVNDTEVHLVTAPDSANVVQRFIRDETTGELTRPSLETLAIIAYRGPVTKAEIELIRGVNCSLILRNLMIRGLVFERQEKNDLVPVYRMTFDVLKFLGLTDVSELPDYAKLNQNKSIDELLNKVAEEESAERV